MGDNDEINDALGRAITAEDQALGDAEEGDKWLVILTNQAASAKAVEVDAQAKLDDATDVATQAAAFLASETERLDDEKATLEEVVELIETGEDERAKATQDDADATTALAEVQHVYDGAYDDLAVALGKVDFQVEVNADLATVAANAVAAKNAALTAHQHAAQVLQNAQTHFDDETARVNSEEDTFAKVEALMAPLA